MKEVKEGQRPGPWGRGVGGVDHRWGPGPSTLICHPARGLRTWGGSREGQAGGGGGEQDNSRRTSSVQYGRLSHYYYNIL